jgi:antitoxin (DNA-binding transcriptional repressor) of toxin-antitoxin stability system
MIRVTVTELKSSLSRYLRLVKQGEVVEILERSVPIARLEAMSRPATNEDAVRVQLIRDGIVSPARDSDGDGAAFLELEPVPCSGNAVRALIDERGAR